MTFCPYCQREMPEPEIYRAIHKEGQIWRPYDYEMPDSWTESPDSSTVDNYSSHWWIIDS